MKDTERPEDIEAKEFYKKIKNKKLSENYIDILRKANYWLGPEFGYHLASPLM